MEVLLGKDYSSFFYDSKIKAFFVAIYQNFDIFFWAFLLIFIPTLFIGAGFPLISSLAGENTTSLGYIYFFNILGNVFGTLITGFVLLPIFGIMASIKIFILTGVVMFINMGSKGTAWLKINSIVFISIILMMFYIPSTSDFYSLIYQKNENQQVYVEEGFDGNNIIFDSQDSTIMWGNGMVQGIKRKDLIYNTSNIRSLNSITFYENNYNTRPKEILIIGLGGSLDTEFLLNNSYSVDVVELSPSLVKNLKNINNPLSNPNLNLIMDDGRRFLYRTNKKYDIILMEALKVHESHSNNIYSKEFFELVKQHLNERGIFETFTDREQKVLPNTLAQVFKYVYVLKGHAIGSEFEINDLEPYKAGSIYNTDYKPRLEYFIIG